MKLKWSNKILFISCNVVSHIIIIVIMLRSRNFQSFPFLFVSIHNRQDSLNNSHMCMQCIKRRYLSVIEKGNIFKRFVNTLWKNIVNEKYKFYIFNETQTSLKLFNVKTICDLWYFMSRNQFVCKIIELFFDVSALLLLLLCEIENSHRIERRKHFEYQVLWQSRA
jgi:hypothetical protein